MALADLFIDQRPTIGLLKIDASVSESHEEAAEITSEPVELGSDITDHIIDSPTRLSMEGLVSANFRWLDARSPFDFVPDRHIKAWDLLLSLKESKIPFAVVTTLRAYTSMVFESLVAVRDLQNSNVLRFQASLRQIQIAGSGGLEPSSTISALGKGPVNAGLRGLITASLAVATIATGAVQDAAVQKETFEVF